MEIISRMQVYSVQFLSEVGAWLVDCPVAMVFVCLSLAVASFSVFGKMVNAR